MSIPRKLRSLERANELVRYSPRAGVAKRRLYLTAQAAMDLNDPNSATNMLTGRGQIEAALTWWASGGHVYGNKTRGLFLDRLDPPPSEIWEIRVRESIVQARLFGRFAEPDTLILTKFHTRPLLGTKGSKGWKAAMRDCENVWSNSLGLPVFSATSPTQYVTENCDDFPI